ncbi:porin family protein [Roseovarius sp. A46]|uniref:outer membrane protein n=1 Tax=Roseovarius sp. A46 TaxID=2109331 RepID=UPI000E83D555|nr:outer membrane beta-barrel protein [Roseovarius sp. A46]RXV66915.1 porin family protein [Roseovarius sp. A46]HAW47869.1 porin family protein [Roseovarius sp.]
MFKTTTAIATVATLTAMPALAGNVTEPTPEPVVEAPAPAPAAPLTPNWTGFYGGGQLGWAWVDTDTAGVDGDDLIGGLVAGYDYDLGDWVVGGGLDYDFADIGLSGTTASVEKMARAKVRGGYKIGRGLAYGTGGYAWADTDNIGDDDGWFIGGGYEHLVTENISVGGEVLYHQFDNFGTASTDVDATTAQVRATFRF